MGYRWHKGRFLSDEEYYAETDDGGCLASLLGAVFLGITLFMLGEYLGKKIGIDIGKTSSEKIGGLIGGILGAILGARYVETLAKLFFGLIFLAIFMEIGKSFLGSVWDYLIK